MSVTHTGVEETWRSFAHLQDLLTHLHSLKILCTWISRVTKIMAVRG